MVRRKACARGGTAAPPSFDWTAFGSCIFATMTDAIAFAPPALRPAEKAALRDFQHFYEPHAAAIQEELMRVCLDMPEWAPILRAMTPQQMAEQNKRSMELQRAAL